MRGLVIPTLFLSYGSYASALSGHSSGSARAQGHTHGRRAAQLQDRTLHLNITERDTSLSKRDQFENARFTNFAAGTGACGTPFTDSDFVVALNVPQWDNMAHCYKSITISYQGQTAQAKIMDECMGCPPDGLDLTAGLFSYLVPSPDSVDIIGTVYGSWSFNDGEDHTITSTAQQTTTKTSATPTTTSSTTSTTSTTSSSETTSTSTSTSSSSSSQTSTHSTSAISSSTATTASSTSSTLSTSSTSSGSQTSASVTPSSASFLEDLTQAYLRLGEVAAAHAAGGGQ